MKLSVSTLLIRIWEINSTSVVIDGNCSPSAILHIFHQPSETKHASSYRLLFSAAARQGRIGGRLRASYEAEHDIDGTTWEKTFVARGSGGDRAQRMAGRDPSLADIGVREKTHQGLRL